jgi:hypothetical protein
MVRASCRSEDSRVALIGLTSTASGRPRGSLDVAPLTAGLIQWAEDYAAGVGKPTDH